MQILRINKYIYNINVLFLYLFNYIHIHFKKYKNILSYTLYNIYFIVFIFIFVIKYSQII